MKSFKGTTALVTGASSGIGKEFARQLAAEGADVILTARRKEELSVLSEKIKSKYSVQAHVIVSDLTDLTAPRKIFQEVTRKGLRVDLLVSNAGFGRNGAFENADDEQDQAMLAVNVNAVTALTHLFIPGMLARGSGGIINVASTAAFQPLPFISLYAATKAFVLSFSEGLWGEYRKRNIRVLCICPGNTRTEFHDRARTKKRAVFLTANAGDVVKRGLRIFRNTQRPTTIYGTINRLLAQGYRLLPRAWMIAVGRFIYKPVK